MCCGRPELMPEEAVDLGMSFFKRQRDYGWEFRDRGADNPEPLAVCPHMNCSLEGVPNPRHWCQQVSCQLSEHGDSETWIGCCHLLTAPKAHYF